LGLLCAYLYATLHYLVTPLVLGWVGIRRREAYPRARSALLLATAFGLLGYWLAPTAPPRLLDTGLTDTMAVFSGAGWWGDAASAPRGMESLSNQYAAMPSLHVGWALWVALVVYRHARGPLARGLAVAYPVLMSVVVMATANHYLLDVVAGIACALAADHLCTRWARRRASGATDVTVRSPVDR
jgi:membrane-associated phospholipid phosphatase